MKPTPQQAEALAAAVNAALDAAPSAGGVLVVLLWSSEHGGGASVGSAVPIRSGPDAASSAMVELLQVAPRAVEGWRALVHSSMEPRGEPS
jgi:hypothetical protein